MAAELAQIEAIFHEALTRAAGAPRAAYLDQACAGIPAVRQRVEALLASHEQADGFFPLPTASAQTLELTIHESPGSIVGRYKLLQQIGEGGFGVVFMAEQEAPVRRRVALKIIKLGMDTRHVVARFEAERQALAMMDHPGIARVFDAGATDTGRPYFVMELVKGVPIIEYCDRHNLDVSQRLDLFVQVCQAVQHAHQKGLIHRDIKPSNVLVAVADDRPVAKVIDFGIAKAVNQRLTEKTLFTEFRQLIGTPEYMSPEQAQGSLDIDTRSDVYALGVLLYELLTGSPPFDPKELRSKAFEEMQRIIREVDPPTPSNRLSGSQTLPSVAASRRTEPRSLCRTVRGELDWIVMKCLEKNRARRYESVAALAADVMHHLADEPISAGAPSQIHRLRKFVRRYRGPVTAAAVVSLVLLAGIIGTTIGLLREARQRRVADQQRALAEEQRAEAMKQRQEAESQTAIANAVIKFQAGMLASADPAKLKGDKVTVLDVMKSAVTELDAGALGQHPLVEASVREIIGQTLQMLGRYDQAEPNFNKALELRRRVQGPTHLDTARALTQLASLAEAKGKFDVSESLLRQSLDIRRSAPGGPDPSIRYSQYALAHLMRQLGRYDEGEKLAREALAGYREHLPADDPALAQCMNVLAVLLQAQGKEDQAERLLRDSLKILRSKLPAGHPDLADVVSTLGAVQAAQAKYTDAEASLAEALEIRRKAFPAGHPSIAGSLSNLTLALQPQGRYADAETLLREAVEISRTAPYERAAYLANLATLLEFQGRSADAEPLLVEALAIDQQNLPAGHPNIAIDMAALARVRANLGRAAEAERLLRDSLRILRGALPAGHPDIATALERLSAVLSDQGKLAEAEAAAKESLDIRRSAFPASHPAIAASLQDLGCVLADQDKPADAEPLFLDAVRIRRQALPAGHPYIAQSLSSLAWVLLRQQEYEPAERAFRDELTERNLAAEKDPHRMGAGHHGLGTCLIGLDRFSQAETELLEAERLLSSVKDSAPTSYSGCVDSVVILYEAWDKSEPGKGHDAQVRSWRARLPSARPATTQTMP